MKFILAIVFIAIVATTVNADYPKERDEKFNKIISECRQKFKVTDEEYTKARHDELEEVNENLECLANCILEKAGILKDGQFVIDEAIKMFNKKVGEEKSKIVVDSCKDEIGSSDCNTAYKLHKCFIKNKGY